MNGLDDLRKQAQLLQEQMEQAQQALAENEVQGESGAGMVKVTMNGRHDVKRVVIDPSLLADDREMLEDLVAAAVNDAVRRVEEANRSQMSKLSGGITLPEGFKMPF